MAKEREPQYPPEYDQDFIYPELEEEDMLIRNIESLAKEIGVRSPDAIQKAIFKGTDCGCSFQPIILADITTGVMVAGYAEGADAECPSHELKFPFTINKFWETLKEADQEGVQMWNKWNNESMEEEGS